MDEADALLGHGNRGPTPGVGTATGIAGISDAARDTLAALRMLAPRPGSGPHPRYADHRRLGRTLRRLREASETFAACAEPITELASALARDRPGFPAAAYEQAASALLVLWDWDACDARGDARLLDAVLRSAGSGGRLQLAFFVCPPVDFTMLRGPHPERYLRDDMHGSLLSGLAPRLRRLFEALAGVQVEYELHAILADTDELEYLWRAGGPPVALDAGALEQRWQAITASLESYLTQPVSRGLTTAPRIAGQARVVRLSQLARSAEAEQVRAEVAAEPLHYLDPEDIAAETSIMWKLWCNRGYYNGLPPPSRSSMRRIVVDKFAAYAAQGVLLRELDPDLVVIQTERPALLRRRMLDLGWCHGGHSPLAAVQFFRPEKQESREPEESVEGACATPRRSDG